MGYVAITDDGIWANHIEGSKALRQRILSLSPGDVIELEVDRIVGNEKRPRWAPDLGD